MHNDNTPQTGGCWLHQCLHAGACLDTLRPRRNAPHGSPIPFLPNLTNTLSTQPLMRRYMTTSHTVQKIDLSPCHCFHRYPIDSGPSNRGLEQIADSCFVKYNDISIMMMASPDSSRMPSQTPDAHLLISLFFPLLFGIRYKTDSPKSTTSFLKFLP